MSYNPCVIRGCPFPGVALDDKNYTKAASDALGDGIYFGDADQDAYRGEKREIWFCREHAVTHLFPIIERAKGYTTGQILRDFADDDMM